MATRQASSPVSETELASMRSAWALASGAALAASDTNSASVSVMASLRRSISPSVNSSSMSPGSIWVLASSYCASGSRPSSTPPGSGSAVADPSRTSTGGR